MRHRLIPLTLATLLAGAACAHDDAPDRSAAIPCSKSAGAAKADEYVRQCLEVSPATHPPCNAANACELIVDEIRRGCASIDKNAPAFCADYADKK